MSATKKYQSSVNYVHQNAILCETIKKEQKNEKLYTNFSVSKVYALTGKPNCTHDLENEEVDSRFLNIIKQTNQTPPQKLDYPQTEAQEIGWCTKPLIEPLLTDYSLHHPKKHTEITKFMDAYWRQKEQSTDHT
ncbi:cilia- and flagella-associated protein 144 [Hydra vulgaris]|uniref:cilia- and flagella-associated protein 144 n=1 Tax=Hydra vulgaris TaxID=6087 RepID=UPI001F5E5AB7|nr:protein FAM183A-like [Hydra vulgaris]